MNSLVDWNNIKNISADHPFIICSDKIITYSDFDLHCKKRASALAGKGINSGEFVPIISENSTDFIINVFALWKLNAVPVLLNIRLTESEIIEQIKFTQSKFLILDPSFKKKIFLKGINVLINFSDENFESSSFPFNADSEATAAVFFTSGSTGKAKAVELSFNNLINSAVNGNSLLNQTNEDKWLAALPFYHIGGFSLITRAFLFGGSIIIPHSLSTDDICKSFAEYNPTLTSLVSTQLKRLMESNCRPSKNLKNVLLGGGFIDDDLIKEAQKNGWRITKVYGSTESASFVTALQCDQVLNSSAGKPIHTNKIFIVDDERNELPAGKIGEIVIEGNSIAKGYLNNPEETKRKFQNGRYFTGDIGWIDKDGYLYVEARRVDLIITGGENVNPLEVENELLKHPLILEAAVFAVEDDEWGQAVSAALITRNNSGVTTDEIRNFLKDKIAGFKIPRHIYIVDNFPRSSLGKIQKQILKEKLGIN